MIKKLIPILSILWPIFGFIFERSANFVIFLKKLKRIWKPKFDCYEWMEAIHVCIPIIGDRYVMWTEFIICDSV